MIMANNRMFLFCPECNEAAAVSKHFGSGWHDFHESEHTAGFLNDHMWCRHKDGFDCGTQLELRYETCEADEDRQLPPNVKIHWEADPP